MSLKNYFLSLSLNKKLIGMMLILSLILVSSLTFLYSQAEKALLDEFENQTAELSKAIQIGVEEVTSKGSTDEVKLQNYLKTLNARGVKEISIISNADEIVASTNPMNIGEEVGPRRKERIIKAELGEPVRHPVDLIQTGDSNPVNEITCNDCHNGNNGGVATPDLTAATLLTKTATDGYPDHDNVVSGYAHDLTSNPPHLTQPYWGTTLPGVNRTNDTTFWTNVRLGTQDMAC